MAEVGGLPCGARGSEFSGGKAFAASSLKPLTSLADCWGGELVDSEFAFDGGKIVAVPCSDPTGGLALVALERTAVETTGEVGIL